MRYKNIKTGAIVDSLCIISGGDWVEEKPEREGIVAPYSLEDLEALKLDELKYLAKELDLEVSGKKAELVERISIVFKEQDELEDSEPEEDEFEDEFEDEEEK